MFSSVLLYLLESCIFWTVICIPEFIKELPTEKREEYETLYKQQKELTRKEFYDLCQDWAEKQGAKVKREYREYRLAEERYIKKRDQILKDRLEKTNGSDEAKNYLHELLDLQQNMNITLKVYEELEEEMRHSLSSATLKEATEIWNLLDPAHIN